MIRTILDVRNQGLEAAIMAALGASEVTDLCGMPKQLIPLAGEWEICFAGEKHEWCPDMLGKADGKTISLRYV